LPFYERWDIILKVFNARRKRVIHIKDLVSIIIPCWNARDYIEKCFSSVKAQIYANIEVIVVDNGSSDDSKQLVRRFANGLKISIIENPANYGFSGAMNQGIEASKGEFVFALNLDVELEPDYIEKLVKEFNDPSIGSAIGKLLRPPEYFDGKKIIDTTGHILLANRGINSRGELEEDNGQYDGKTDIFGVCAAAGMYRRGMLEDVKVGGEYFDEDYFASFEDTDLDWRAVLRGWRSVFVPAAVAHHKRKAFDWNYTDEMLSNSRRNKFLNAVKNDYLINYLIDFPVIFAYELENILYKHFKNYHLFFLSYYKMILALPKAFRKRMQFRGRRKIAPLAFRKYIVYEPDDHRKAMEMVFILAFITVLAHFFGAAKIWLFAVFIFFVLNPAIYYMRGKKEPVD
jgi:GT2 family glycosyltransferase